MKVSLNVRRETLEVRLEAEDGLSPRDIQRALRTARVQFSTLSSRGHWVVNSQDVQQVVGALEQFAPVWDARVRERLAHIQEDNRLREVVEGQTSRLYRHLESSASLGLKPFEEQREAAELMSAPGVRRFALFWKPGSGKTGAMIAAAHELLSREVVNGVLVVAERPLAIKTPWRAELAQWLPDSEVENKVAAVSGTKQQRLAVYQSNPRWLIVHYGQLARDQYAIRSWAQRNEGVERPVIIFDESDLIKNSAAQRSKAAMSIRQECGRCWIASGTPAPNSPSDYEHQLAVLSGYPVGLALTGDRTQDALVVVHELEKGFHYLQRENPRKMPEVATPVYVDLSPPQRYEYDRLAREFLSELEVMDDRTYASKLGHVMSRRMSLLRLCSDPGHRSLPSPVFDPPAKLIQLDSLLETILTDPNAKAVVWTRFRDTAFMLHDRYGDPYGAALMIGGGEGSPADLAQPECRLLVATIQVGASSIDLTAASNAIYESLDDVSRNFTQSMARINRTGQTRDCKYWFLVTRDSMEEDLFENTMAKMQVSEEVLEEIGKPGRAQIDRTIETDVGYAALYIRSVGIPRECHFDSYPT